MYDREEGCKILSSGYDTDSAMKTFTAAVIHTGACTKLTQSWMGREFWVLWSFRNYSLAMGEC